MGGPPGRPGPPSVEEHIKFLDQELKLTDDQKTKITSILEDQRASMQKMRDDTSTPREEKMAKMKEQRTATHEKIEAVLDDDQKKKFDAMQKRMDEQHGRMDHQGPRGAEGPGAAPEGTPPPPPPQ